MKTKTIIRYAINIILFWAWVYIGANLDTILYNIFIK
jgi:hypothetical protein